MTVLRIGNWIAEAELGRGPGGTVYRAASADGSAPKFAAVKLLAAADAAVVERFRGEMLALQRLKHPNIARFFDSGLHGGLPYFASELAPGRDLAAMLREQPRLAWGDCVHRVAVQAARALKHAHHRSILHRDLKPSNLVLDETGHLKVTDFGVAKFLAVPPLALPVEPMGSLCYAAPEYFTGKAPTRRSDLYSLGGVLYTLVCGRPPVVAGSAAEAMHKHCYMLPDRPMSFVPSLPVEVDDLLCSLLAKDPAKRPAGAAVVLEELERLRGKLERRGHMLLTPPDIVDPTGQHAPLDLSQPKFDEAAFDDRRRRERFLRGLFLTIAFLVVVGVILFAFFRPRPDAEELWNQAKPLLDSSNPDDWEKARSDYLEKLERWHPGARANEIAEVKQKIADRKELKRTAAAGASVKPASEAERLYRRGLALLSQGDREAAAEAWQSILENHKDAEADRRWLDLAAAGLKMLDDAK
jgi:serine/threonine protein kinase